MGIGRPGADRKFRKTMLPSLPNSHARESKVSLIRLDSFIVRIYGDGGAR